MSEPLPPILPWHRQLADGRGWSLEDALSDLGTAEPTELVATLRVAQRRDWQHGRRVPAEEYIDRAPRLRTNPEHALDLVYAEFLLREELGETPDPGEYARRFPDLAEEFGRQISVHRAVCETPGSLVSDGDAPPAVHERARAPGLPQLAGYELVRELGRGGMGVVYEAADTVMGRRVAVKLIHPELLRHPVAVVRFRREVRAVARLAHPNLVTAFDAGESGGHHFLAMELIEGENLAEVLQQSGPLPVVRACALVRQAALGLQHAHERGLVHRDVKPHNLLLASDGTVKVFDFGLAALTGDRAASGGATSVCAVMGTPDYMAPEQAQDARSAGPRSDVYALGCTLFHLLTGRPPFSRETMMQKLLAHQEEPPPSVRALRPEVPPALDDLVRRALAKRPRRRFRSAGALAEALLPFADPSHIPRPSRRRRLLAGLGVSLLIAVVGAAAFLIASAKTDQLPTRPADVGSAPAPLAAASFREVHGADEKAFLDWVDALAKDGLRPVSLSARAGSDEPRFNGIAVRDGRDLATTVRLGLEGSGPSDHFNQMRGQGYRPLVSCLYNDGGRQKQAHLWVKDGVNFSGYGNQLDGLPALLAAQGTGSHMMPIYLSSESQSRGPLSLTAIFAPDGSLRWWARAGLGADDLRRLADDWRARGWRPTHLNPYRDGDRTLFLAVARDNPKRLDWDCRLGLTAAGYEQALEENARRGLRPASVGSYREGNEDRYAAVWVGVPGQQKGE